MPGRKKITRFILGILLAAVILIWQEQTYHHTNTPTSPSVSQTLPQWQGKNAVIWQLTPTRDKQVVVVSNKLTHFRQPQRTLTLHPRGALLSSSHHYYFEAQKGALFPKKISLKQQVHAISHIPHTLPIHLYTETLTFMPSVDQLTSPAAVKITQGQNWTTGSGLVLNINTQTLQLKHNVISHYVQN